MHYAVLNHFTGMILSQKNKDSWPDPRFKNQFNLKQIELLFQYSGIESVKFESGGDYKLFHAKKN